MATKFNAPATREEGGGVVLVGVGLPVNTKMACIRLQGAEKASREG